MASFSVLAALLGAVPLAAAPEATKVAELQGRPRALVYEVANAGSEDGNEWIRSDAVVEAVFPGKVEDLVAILTEHKGDSSIYSRVESDKVLESGPGYWVTEQVSAIRMLGLAYVSRLVFRTTLENGANGKRSLEFRMIDGDGSSKSVEGSYDMEPVLAGGQEAVYLRYRCTMVVKKRFGIQLWVMQTFGKGDFERTVQELGEAFARRNARGGGSGPSSLPTS